MKSTVKILARNSIIAALYVILTLITYPISFLQIQFRVAEILVLLCFFRKDYLFGVTLGCVIANLFSSIGLIDSLFGGVATLLSCLCVCFCRHLLVAIFAPIAINAFVVGFELYQFVGQPFWLSVGLVAVGETVVMIVSYIFIFLIRKNKSFMDIIGANQNIDFRF